MPEQQQPHLCKPQKFEPEKYYPKSCIIPSNNFFFFREKCKPDSLYVGIYHPDNRNLCYKLYWSKKTGKSFRCYKCNSLKKSVSGLLCKDGNGMEYFKMNAEKHVCKPYNVKEFKGPKYQLLENSGMEFGKPKEIKVDESKIIRIPNFEIRENGKKLIVFHSEKKDLCYMFKKAQQQSTYYCQQCCSIKKLYVTVKMHKSEKDDETFLETGKKEHICEPKKYEKEIPKTIIEAPNFSIYYKNDKTRPLTLIIFTSSTRDLCYQFTYQKREKYFRCLHCNTNPGGRKTVTAKLFQKEEDGSEYIEMQRNEHVCNPRKFDLAKFEPKTFSESEFELHPDKNGKPDTRLIIFISNEKNTVHEYASLSGGIFICQSCKTLKKHVTAKIYEYNNGEKYVELGPNEHICQPKKYDPN